jgi:hypothetical protein
MFRNRIKGLFFAGPLRRPVPIPDATPIEAGACQSRALTVQAFLVRKAFSLRVGKSGMGEIDVLYVPCGVGAGGFTVIGAACAFPEKDQFEAVPFATRRRHITRVIPPFRAKILMLEMVSRKVVGIARQGLAVLKTTTEQWENTKRKCQQLYGGSQNASVPQYPVTMRLPVYSNRFDRTDLIEYDDC